MLLVLAGDVVTLIAIAGVNDQLGGITAGGNGPISGDDGGDSSFSGVEVRWCLHS